MEKDMKKKGKIRYLYLGPPGTHSEIAALKVGNESQLIPCQSFELVNALKQRVVFKQGVVKKIVLPIENLIDGPVDWVFNSLLEINSEFSVEGEIVLPIKQALIGFGKLSDVKVVYSIPKALGQCRNFLNQLKVKTMDTSSTSDAVKLIAEKRDRQLAAIGTKRAAKLFGVPLIKEAVDDCPNNETRFIVLGNKRKRETGKDKTCLVFGTENRPGALYRALEIFDVLGINLTMIISRPSKKKLGEYIFFVDAEIHQENEKMKVALENIAGRVNSLKVLGSFPRAR